MNITFLRHAQSLYNEYNTSDRNCDLSELGKLQASQVSGHYDTIICSIMKRARRTLELSTLTYNNLVYTELCREYKTTIGDFLETEEFVVEKLEEFGRRLEQFKQYIKDNFDRKDVLVLCHGDLIYCLNGLTKYPKNVEFQTLFI